MHGHLLQLSKNRVVIRAGDSGVHRISEHHQLGGRDGSGLLSDIPDHVLVARGSRNGSSVLVVVEVGVSEIVIIVKENLVDVNVVYKEDRLVDGVWEVHKVEVVEEGIAGTGLSVEEEGESGLLVEVAISDALVHNLDFKFESLALDGVLGGGMEPDFVRDVLSSVGVGDGTEIALHLHHALFPNEGSGLARKLVENEERFGGDIVEVGRFGEVDGALLAALDALAFPVDTMSVEVPAIIAPSALLAHIDNGLLVKNLLDNHARVLFPGNSESFGDRLQPHVLDFLGISADSPVIVLGVLDLEAEAARGVTCAVDVLNLDGTLDGHGVLY